MPSSSQIQQPPLQAAFSAVVKILQVCQCRGITAVRTLLRKFYKMSASHKSLNERFGFISTLFVLYRRVSSDAQRVSGLGLMAQMEEMQTYLGKPAEPHVIADLVEVQSGKDDKNRPVLKEAMDLANSTGAVLLVSLM